MGGIIHWMGHLRFLGCTSKYVDLRNTHVKEAEKESWWQLRMPSDHKTELGLQTSPFKCTAHRSSNADSSNRDALTLSFCIFWDDFLFQYLLEFISPRVG